MLPRRHRATRSPLFRLSDVVSPRRAPPNKSKRSSSPRAPQARMEGIVLQEESGSLPQRVKAEFVTELVSKIEVLARAESA